LLTTSTTCAALLHGEGEHAWERSGDTEDGAWFNTRNQYKGGFKAGMRHGVGVFLYATVGPLYTS
jgi:hypothetical protein